MIADNAKKSPSPPRIRATRPAAAGSARGYDRDWDLPRLLPLWPHEVADTSIAGRERVLARLKRALRAERRRGVAGHWTYDLGRHAQLAKAYRCELAELTAERRLLRRLELKLVDVPE